MCVGQAEKWRGQRYGLEIGVAHPWLICALFSMYLSQRIQESCQSGTKWLVETQVKARRRKREAQKGSSVPARSLNQRSTRLSGTTPAHSTLGPWERERHHHSTQRGSRAHPLRRSRREAAFRSPYSSAEPLCSPRQVEESLASKILMGPRGF